MSPWDWRVIESRVNAAPKDALREYKLLFIQHVLADLLHLIDACIRVGCAATDITVIGIPYSSRFAVSTELEAKFPGLRVVLPIHMPFDGYVSTILLEVLAQCEAESKRLIVIEDGGYTVPLLSHLTELGKVKDGLVVGAVEQTTRGTRIDVSVERQGNLTVPVISIPDCMLKQSELVEPPAIAAAVNRNLRELLLTLPFSAAREIERVGLMGFGAIGRNVAAHLQSQGATVYVSDLNTARTFEIFTADKFHALTVENLATCDLVIGATGETSIGPSVLPVLKNGAILASASSRQIEIDVPWLESKSRIERLGPRANCSLPLHAYSKCSFLDGTKTLYLLYEGYPINFWGESLPDEIADVVLSLLFSAIIRIASTSLEVMVYRGGAILGNEELEIAGICGLFGGA